MNSSKRNAIVADLRRFYDDHHIAPGAAFNCVHKAACTADSGRALTHGAEAHVGTRYGGVLKIAVISLDTGGGSDALERRTSIIEGLAGKKMNPHMRGTTQLLEALLHPYLGDESPLTYFAMINAAKCAATDGRRDMVPAELYERCRPFGEAELKLLDPDVVVAQGRTARGLLPQPSRISREHLEKAMNADLHVPSFAMDWLNAVANEYLRTINVGRRRAVALITPHPSARGGQWQRFVRLSLAPVSMLVRQLAQQGPAV